MVMHLKKEFNGFKFDTLDLPKEVKYEREIKLEFYKNLSSDSIEDLKRKKTKKRENSIARRGKKSLKSKNSEGKEDNEVLDN